MLVTISVCSWQMPSYFKQIITSSVVQDSTTALQEGQGYVIFTYHHRCLIETSDFVHFGCPFSTVSKPNLSLQVNTHVDAFCQCLRALRDYLRSIPECEIFYSIRLDSLSARFCAISSNFTNNADISIIFWRISSDIPTSSSKHCRITEFSRRVMLRSQLYSAFQNFIDFH